MKKLALILSLFLHTFAVFAQQTLSGTGNDVFRPLSKHLVEKVVAAGIHRSGRLDLRRLLRELDTVEWSVQDLVFFAGSGGQRITSIYLVEERRVIVNLLSLQNLVGQPVPLYGWALHEGLGALGYSDENYELSIAIEYMAKNIAEMPARERLVRPQFREMDARTNRNQHYESSGGTTVVGGGGDAPIIQLKSLLLDRLPAWTAAMRPGTTPRELQHAINRLIRFPIEFANDESRNSIEFNLVDGKLVLDEGGQRRFEAIYADIYLDRILNELAPLLFP
jgi:hypothetical protein